MKNLMSGQTVLVILIVLIILVGCIWLYKNYSKTIEKFDVTIDDLDGSAVAASSTLTVADELQNQVAQVLAGTSVNATVATPPSPGLCEQESLCSGIRDPINLPVKLATDSQGCGWYFAEDADKPSFPAWGTKDGPISAKIRKQASGGKWYFTDISGAQMAEDRKRCDRITSCKLADLYPNQCVFCDGLGHGVPINAATGDSKYPDDDDLNCQGRLISLPENCPAMPNLPAVTNAQGVIIIPEKPPRDICALFEGKMQRGCLIFLAKAAGLKENGNLIKIIKSDADQYTVNGTENNKKLVALLELIRINGRLAYNIEYFGNGDCNRKDVISYFTQLVDLVIYGETEEVRQAAGWLVNGTFYNFDKCTSGMRGPYELTFLQRLFRNAGGQPDGTSYPKAETLNNYNNVQCSKIQAAFNKLCTDDMKSTDSAIQLKASKKCLGIKITTPLSGCMKRPPFTPNVDCNVIINSGSLLIGDVKADTNSGAEVFWYSYSDDPYMPRRATPQGTFLGREIRMSIPSFNELDTDYFPFANLKVTSVAMVVRAKITSDLGNIGPSSFKVIANDGAAISVDDQIVLDQWAKQATVSAPPTGLNVGSTLNTKVYWYNTSFTPKLGVQMLDKDGNFGEVNEKNCRTRVPKGFPIVRFDLYTGQFSDANAVVSMTGNGDLTVGALNNKKGVMFNGENSYLYTNNKLSGSAFFTFTTMLFVKEITGPYKQNRFFCIRQGGNTSDPTDNARNSVSIEGGVNGKDNTVNIMLKSNSTTDDPKGNNILLVTSPANAITLNTWTHVSAVFSSCMTNCKLFINGVKVAEGSNPDMKKGYYTDRIYDYGALGHGYSNFGGTTSPMPFKGGIAWAHWFDYPLADADVMDDFNNKFVDPNVYPGGQDAGWNVPNPRTPAATTTTATAQAVPGCPVEDSAIFNPPNPYRFTNPNANAGPKEVFHVGGYVNQSWNAASKCSEYGAKVASKAQLVAAQAAGADWCSTGWVSDNGEKAIYPITTSTMGGCGNGRSGIIEWTPPSKLAGVHCYGVKPQQGKHPEVLPWSGTTWSQRGYIAPVAASGGNITITEASYGKNCNAALVGNRTSLFQGLVAGKSVLDYAYNYTTTGGDPAQGCPKELNITYTCGTPGVKTFNSTRGQEAGFNSQVRLECPPPVAAVSNSGSSSTNTIGNVARSATNVVGNAARSATNAVGNAANSTANKVGNATVSAANTVGRAASSTANAVSNAAKSTGNFFRKFF